MTGRGVLCRVVGNTDLIYGLLGKLRAIRYNYSLFTASLQPSVERCSMSASNLLTLDQQHTRVYGDSIIIECFSTQLLYDSIDYNLAKDSLIEKRKGSA